MIALDGAQGYILAIGCLILAMSALVSRKLDWRRGSVMALVWVGIFIVIAAIFSAIGA